MIWLGCEGAGSRLFFWDAGEKFRTLSGMVHFSLAIVVLGEGVAQVLRDEISQRVYPKRSRMFEMTK